MDWWLAFAGLLIGVIVGMTGMGGGALMTPVLVLFFGIPPLSAVSNDLVVSAVTKPVGGAVHLRRGTVNVSLVKWLSIGSVPSAFAGVFIARAFGSGPTMESVIRTALGVALLLAAASLIVKSYLRMAEAVRAGADLGEDARSIAVRPAATLLVGGFGGLIVGMTSVGSGSLVIIALLALYPRLLASSLVGTDLVSSVPLVLSAAIAHILFGDFHADVTVPLLIGTLPGTYLGALFSARVPDGLLRRVLTLVLLASGLKLLDVGNLATAATLAGAVVIGGPLWMLARARHGFAPLAIVERRRAGRRADFERVPG